MPSKQQTQEAQRQQTIRNLREIGEAMHKETNGDPAERQESVETPNAAEDSANDAAEASEPDGSNSAAP